MFATSSCSPLGSLSNQALRISPSTAGLAPGSYRATLTAKDPEGNAGAARVSFEIPQP